MQKLINATADPGLGRTEPALRLVHYGFTPSRLEGVSACLFKFIELLYGLRADVLEQPQTCGLGTLTSSLAQHATTASVSELSAHSDSDACL